MIHAVVLFVALLLPQQEDSQEYLSWLFEKLESSDANVRSSSYTALLNEKNLFPRLFDGFEQSSSIGRELRASLLVERGDSSSVETAIGLLKDSDPKVRESLIRFLSRADLSAPTLVRRLEELEKIALGPDFQLAEEAVKGLGKLDEAQVPELLVRIFRKALFPDLRRASLEALGKQSHAANALLDIAQNPGEDYAGLLVVLPALANRAESRVLPSLLKHCENPDSRVRTIVHLSFAQLQNELTQRQEFEAAEKNYRAWNDRKVENPESLFDEISFHLNQYRNLDRVRELSDVVSKMLREKSDRESLIQKSRNSLFIALVGLMQGKVPEFDERIQEALTVLGQVEKSLDDVQDAQLRYRCTLMSAKAHLLFAVHALLNPDPARPKIAEEQVQAAYEVSRRTQEAMDSWLGNIRKAPPGAKWFFSFDDALSDEFGFYSLAQGALLKSRGATTVESLWLRLSEIFAKFYPREFISLVALDAPEPPGVEGRFAPELLRMPSLFALRFSEFCKQILGKQDLSLKVLKLLSERWRNKLNDIPSFALQVAQVEFRIGSIYMDQRLGDECEKAHLRGIAILEDYERWARARTGDDNPDPRVQMQLGAAYVSLAVNENVVRARPQEARKHLERANQLDPSPFNRVLLACYQARAGEAESARKTLNQVDIEPNLYYNFACTHALLGEKAKALHYLDKYFNYLSETPGDKQSSIEWSQKDPDLDSIKASPEFKALIEQAKADVKKNSK